MADNIDTLNENIKSMNISIVQDNGNFILKYGNKDLISINKSELETLTNKFNADIDEKLSNLIKQNLDLQSKILNTQENLSDEEKKSLDDLYLELLKTEINIILRDLYELSETVISDIKLQNDVKPILDTLTNKFRMINEFLLEHKSHQNKSITQTGGTKLYCSKTSNYCKYIKYKLKYVNLKNLI